MGSKSKSRKKKKARVAARSALAHPTILASDRGPVVPVTAMPRPQRSTEMEFTLVPGPVPIPDQANLDPPPPGERGAYAVTFVLGVPGTDDFRMDLDFSTLGRSGTSLLQMPPDAISIEMTVAAQVPVQFFSEQKGGVLSRALIRLTASNFEEAQRSAFEILMPILSYWSYVHEIAIDTTAYDVIEERTGVRKYVVGVVGVVQRLQVGRRYVSTPEHRRLFAAYREGMNTTNIFYRVLSFYKVTEGIRTLRTRRHREAGNKGKPQGDSTETIPLDVSDLSNYHFLSQKAFLPYLGQEFDAVLDSLETLVRNAVAHLDPHSDVLDADRFEDVAICNRAEPVLAYIARKMLEGEMALLDANTPDVP